MIDKFECGCVVFSERFEQTSFREICAAHKNNLQRFQEKAVNNLYYTLRDDVPMINED